MMDVLHALEETSLSLWIKEASTIWAYPTILTLHTVGLALLVGANWAFALRLLGFADRIPLEMLRKTFTVMWVGFWINALSGLLLFMADATTKGATLLFLSKLGLVAVGVSVIMVTRKKVYANGTSTPVIGGDVKALAVVSLVVWVAAITAGRMMAYI